MPRQRILAAGIRIMAINGRGPNQRLAARHLRVPSRGRRGGGRDPAPAWAGGPPPGPSPLTASLMAPIAAQHPGTSPELFVLAIGAGALFFSHLNDGGFWLVKE